MASVDTLWVITATALVFVMQAGFLCLEAGLTRVKNSVNVAIKNVADFGISMALFWLFGFALMFGASHSGIHGSTRFMPDVGACDAKLATFFLFQAVFCGTAVTIVSGAVAERVRFVGYLLMAVIVSAVIYPVAGHWVWGGAIGGEPGWLAAMGFRDFAGSTVVHSVGGWAGLAAAIILGARTGRFEKGRPAREVTASNLPMAMLGVLLLWFGWIGFNGGSTLAFTNRVPGIIANTMLGATAGMIVASAVAYIVHGYPHASGMFNGVVGGLVAITAGADVVSTQAAVAIGAGGGAIAMVGQYLLDRWHIDDAVSAVPCHLAAGAWGTIAVGFFGNLSLLGTGLSRWEQIGVQALGVVACGLWAGVGSFMLLRLVNHVSPLRVSVEDEQAGLNVSEHKASNDLHDFVTVIEEQAQSGDLSLRAKADPFTEVGQIAGQYNKLMEALQQSKTDIDELSEAQRALEEAIEEAESANAAKSEFLANMSHEIRTPLHGILSFAGFGIKKTRNASPEKIESYFEKIDTSGRRLLLLINDLLDLAKMESGRMVFQFEQQDLIALGRNVTDEFTSLLSEQKLSIRFVHDAPRIDAEVDYLKIMQVVRNLLNNAVKFSPPESTIDIRLQADKARAMLEVRDHGQGVPEDELRTIFDKFIQSSKTKSGAGGTGLGLAICEEVVAGHGGRIWVENHPDGGAVFKVELPLRQERARLCEPQSV